MKQDTSTGSASGSFLSKLGTFTKGVWINLFTYFVMQFVFAGLYAVLLNLYLARAGYRIEFIGLVNMAGALGFAAFAIPAGIFGKRWGHKNMIVIGLAGAAVFPSLMLLSGNLVPGLRETCTIIFHGLYSLSTTLLAVNGITFLANDSTDDSRVHVFSVYGAIAPLAGFFGSLIAGFLPGIIANAMDKTLEDALPYAAPIWIAPALFFICLVVFVLVTRGYKSRTETAAAAAAAAVAASNAGTDSGSGQQKEKAPVSLFIIMFLVTVLRISSFYALFVFFSIYLDSVLKISTDIIGVITATGRLIPAIAALFTPMLVRRSGKFRLVIILSVFSAVFTLPISLFPGLVAAIISLVAISAANAITSSAFTTLHQEATPEKWRSLMAGSVFSAEAISFALMAFFGGFMIQPLGYQPFFLVSVFTTLASGILFWILLKNRVTKK